MPVFSVSLRSNLIFHTCIAKFVSRRQEHKRVDTYNPEQTVGYLKMKRLSNGFSDGGKRKWHVTSAAIMILNFLCNHQNKAVAR